MAFETAAGPRLSTLDAEIGVRVVGARAMRRLGRDFLGDDHATDVLSFPAGPPWPEAGVDQAARRYLGDIALCWPVAVAQAAEFGHPVETEAALLCVHGLLHLLGHDHHNPRAEARMWALTHACLAAAGVNNLGSERLQRRVKMGRS